MLVVICGGGPGGAVAAHRLAQEGVEAILLEKNLSRIKPCGGAIPPALLREFDIPDYLIEQRVEAVTAYSASGHSTRVEIVGGYIGMINRETFDPFLRNRAAQAGALVVEARVDSVDATERGAVVTCTTPDGRQKTIQPDCIIGADGANSFVARKLGLSFSGRVATTLQERLAFTSPKTLRLKQRCELYFDTRISPDFYGWVFPKANHVVVGTAACHANLSPHLAALKHQLGLDEVPVLSESAPLPLRPLRRWTANRVALVGDAAGLVAAGTGEGIYYAMKSGVMAAEGILACKSDLRAEKLDSAYQKAFWGQFGGVFRHQDALQAAFYKNDGRREALLEICRDPDVQNWMLQSYLYKRMDRTPLLTAIKLKARHAYHLTKARLGHYNLHPTEPALLP